MCGIFGIAVKKDSIYSPKTITEILDNLSINSESRGKDSSGFAGIDETLEKIEVLKSQIPVSNLIKEKSYLEFIHKILENNVSDNKLKRNLVFMGHSRLVTNGDHLNNDNNQPIIKSNILGIHNGIIVNEKDLWSKNQNLNKEFEIALYRG